jgi:hypothetical protein
LAAELESNGHLGHRRIPDVLAFRVDAALAERAADTDAAFSDRRKNGVSVSRLEEVGALAGVLEDIDRFLVVVVGPSELHRQDQRQQCEDRNQTLEHGFPFWRKWAEETFSLRHPGAERRAAGWPRAKGWRTINDLQMPDALAGPVSTALRERFYNKLRNNIRQAE